MKNQEITDLAIKCGALVKPHPMLQETTLIAFTLDELKEFIEQLPKPPRIGGSALNDELGTDALRAFAQEVMECWPMGGIDGGDLQDIAERHGLLRPETRYAPCYEDGCNCAEYVTTSEFEQGVTCFLKTPLLLGLNAKLTGRGDGDEK